VEGALYPLYYVLQDLAVDFAVFGQLGFDAGKFCFLLVVTDGDAAHPPCFPAFLDSSVVDMAAEHEEAIKHPLLFGSGLEFVLEGFAYCLLFHVILLCLIGAKVVTNSGN